ncbi:hypothetical protein FA13DRAFT_1802585 [Coprinellus micaceus]|uniref:Uncharacterized protein n=1 Tax=Coprinellus micaceus TaxID=71717 RepID=A0A4Y7SCN6_COPMI|nr:hypothetical protein FA13DRAFT_1802585 [Coprinellus micaceus]
MYLRSQTRARPIRLSDRLQKPGSQLHLPFHRSKLPHDILAIVFAHLRETVTLRSPKPVWREARRLDIVVGPLMQITMVCWYWREVALSCPFLWSAIPVLVESGKLLALANAQQVWYHLQLANQAPLKLVIGARKDLGGPGVKYQYSLTYQSLDFIAELAPRVRDLAIAFQPDSDMLPVLHKPPHRFTNLETLTFMGASQPNLLLEQANLSGCDHLHRVVWGFCLPASVPPPSFLMTPPVGLTEVLLADSWDATVPSDIAHAFLRAAKELVKFHSRISHSAPESTPTNFERLPLLQHNNLQTLSIIFQGPTPDASLAPLIHALRTPHLTSFSFELDWSATFSPTAVTGWVRTNGHSLTTFECFSGHVKRTDLLLCLRAMPLLEVFKFAGAVSGSRRLRVAGVSPDKVLVDQQFLAMFTAPVATDVGLGQDSSGGLSTEEEMPCPALQEIHFDNTYFSSSHLDSFIKGRLYGNTRISSKC